MLKLFDACTVIYNVLYIITIIYNRNSLKIILKIRNKLLHSLCKMTDAACMHIGFVFTVRMLDHICTQFSRDVVRIFCAPCGGILRSPRA